jgi:hypothetical protein
MGELPGKDKYHQTGVVDVTPFTAVPQITNLTISAITRHPGSGDPLERRKSVLLQNISTTDPLFFGFSNAITDDSPFNANTGWKIGPGGSLVLDLGDEIPLFFIDGGVAVPIQLMELR